MFSYLVLINIKTKKGKLKKGKRKDPASRSFSMVVPSKKGQTEISLNYSKIKPTVYRMVWAFKIRKSNCELLRSSSCSSKKIPLPFKNWRHQFTNFQKHKGLAVSAHRTSSYSPAYSAGQQQISGCRTFSSITVSFLSPLKHPA